MRTVISRRLTKIFNLRHVSRLIYVLYSPPADHCIAVVVGRSCMRRIERLQSFSSSLCLFRSHTQRFPMTVKLQRTKLLNEPRGPELGGERVFMGK